MPSRLQFQTDLYGSYPRPSMDTAVPVDGSGHAAPPTTRRFIVQAEARYLQPFNNKDKGLFTALPPRFNTWV